MKVEKNCKVVLEYEGRLESGEIFDSSKHGDHSHPLEFVVGSGQVIRGFNSAVLNMERGQSKEFKIKSEDAYGKHNPELKQEIPKEMIPNHDQLKTGMTLVMGTPEGQQIPIRILEVKQNSVILDLNHPLAGKNLIFKIKVLDVVAQKKDKDKGGKNS